jgi:hypothetical protein
LAIAPLIEAATNKGPERSVQGERYQATRSLANLRDSPEVEKVLKDAANGPEDGIRKAADLALKGQVWGERRQPELPGRPYPK